MREPIIDPRKELTQEQYDAELAAMTPERLEQLREEYWDNPALVECFNRLRFANIPSVPDFDTLTRFAPPLPSAPSVFIFISFRQLEDRFEMACIDIERILTTRLVPERTRTPRAIVVGGMRGVEWDYFLYRLQENGFRPVLLKFSYIYFILISFDLI